MPCYRPLEGWKSKDVNPKTGKRRVVFQKSEGLVDLPVTVPCGQCIGCRLERSRQWAMRCVHESMMYEDNCFITLTYNDENLPADWSLNVREFQLFMKRLRKKYGDGIRFFHCGEYGAKEGRPHYHAILFNHDFEDKKLWMQSKSGELLYRSQSLEELWPHGYSSVGNMTFESAAYVARYVLKKVTGDEADSHYEGRLPEYTTMSRRPGIGSAYYEQYRSNIFPNDFVVMRGRKMPPPRYYSGMLEAEDPNMFQSVRAARKRTKKTLAADSTSRRLKDRETCKIAQISRLERTLD